MVVHQSGPMKMNHAYRQLHTKCGPEKNGVTVRISLQEFSFLMGVYEVLDANYASEKTGARILCAWKQKTEIAAVWSKAKHRVKITSRFRHGRLRLVWFVLQSSSIYSPFFMARFGMRELCACFSWHVYLMIITRERVLCGCTLWRNRESFRSVYRLLERLSSFFVVLLTCRFTRVYVLILPTQKAAWNMKPIKWKCAKLPLDSFQ